MKQILGPILCLALMTGGAAAQSNYPDKPIRFITGGATQDIVARVIGPKWTETLGTPVVVETALGAAGNLAAERVAKSAPDGYTILISGDAAMTTKCHPL